jgi:hypothetical protein
MTDGRKQMTDDRWQETEDGWQMADGNEQKIEKTDRYLQNSGNKLIFICGAGAQLAWLYALASFLIFSFFQRIYPLPETAGIFCLASLLTLIHRGRRWRMIQIVLLHIGGTVIAGLWIIYTFYNPPGPWWGLNWLGEFFSLPRGPGDWLLLFFVAVYTIGFYSMGVRFARETKTYTVACSRFDRGLMAFFGLLLLKLLIRFRFEIEFDDSLSYLMIFPFFIFSLMEIGLARHQEADHHKRYLSGYHVVGLSASFTAGAFIISAGIFIFFLPYLNIASAVGYDLMKNAAAPLEPILISIVKFIFGHADWRQSVPGPSAATGSVGSAASSSFLLLVRRMLTWRNGLLFIVLGIGVGLLLVSWLVRWLFQKRDGQSQTVAPWRILSWLYRLKALWLIFCQWIFRSRTKRTAIQYYTALQRWGRFSGFSRRLDETPSEYGLRLSQQFPQLGAEVMLIIEMLHWEVYAEATLNANQMIRIRKSWKKLHSPSKWPLRIKAMMANT